MVEPVPLHPYCPTYIPTYGKSLYENAPRQAPSKRTQSPMVTGTSILAMKFNGGVVLAADTLGSYGSLARYRSIERLSKFGDYTIVGCGGDVSDMQWLNSHLEEVMIHDYVQDDGKKITPKELHSYVTRVMYGQRSKMDPLWNQVVIAGVQGNEPFLGYVDMQGTAFENETVATGYGAYIAQPLLREASRSDLTQQDAVRVIKNAMRVMFYRDARTINNIQVAVVSKEGCHISDPIELDTMWKHGESIDRDGSF